MMTTEQISYQGKPALKITCTCATHLAGKSSAVMVGRTSLPADRIHGYVLMANHPALPIKKSAERKGIYAA